MTDVDKISQDSIKAVLNATSSGPQTCSRKEAVMGGHGTIILVGAGEDLLQECWNKAHKLESLWSRFRATSEITSLNMAEGRTVRVSPETVRLVGEMIRGNQVTEGYFDPSLLPDVIEAGYTTSQTSSDLAPQLPASATSPGNLAGIEIHEDSVTLPQGTVLDPGGIGKGLAADLIASYAMEQGAWGAMVELGGDIVVSGIAPDQVAWRLGVENPFDTSNHIEVVRLRAGAVATSSQLKRRFKNAHHLIDRQTHKSAETHVQTVTVIAATGAMAEVITKRGFAQRPEEFIQWVPSVGAAALLVLEDGTTLTSENWSKYR